MTSMASLQDDRAKTMNNIRKTTCFSDPFIRKTFLFGMLVFISLIKLNALGPVSSPGNGGDISSSNLDLLIPNLALVDPQITVRCANPQYSCSTNMYCLDVEFKSDVPNKELFGMNVRFLYDDSVLEFSTFNGFLGGYGSIAPNPAIVSYLSNGVPWGFASGADYANGAIQKVNQNAPAIFISTTNWTKLFQICFTVDNAPDENNFSPSVVWDLEQNPANGGYPTGSAGVVMTVVTTTGSANAIEAVDPFNWHYIGSGAPPYGEPFQEVTSNISCGTCALTVTSTADAGPNTLRDIISCASSGDTIVFAPALAGATITVSTTKLIVSKNLYIRSNLTPKLKITSTIPGLFEIAPGKTVEFKDVEITSGTTLSDNSGAAFKNQGILKLVNVKLFKNVNLGSAQYLVKNWPSSQILLYGSCFIEIP